MKPERVYRALTCLLQGGLWQELPPVEGVFPLEETEWEALYVLAGKQAVHGIVWDGIRLLPKAWCPPRKCLAKWLLTVERGASRYACLEERMKEQAAVWEWLGLTALLLKGQGVAAYYPVPEHRTCGDIDWYFPNPEEWKTAILWAEAQNCLPETDSDGDVHYTWKEVLVEHHRSWDHLSRPASRKLLKKLELEEGYETWKGIRVLTPILNLLLLNTHILKHALVLGVGIRQLGDLAMAYRYYEGRYDGERLKRVLKQLGLLKWTELVHAVLVEVIGMPVRYLPYPQVGKVRIEPLMRQIWKDGNFGMYRDEKQVYTEKTAGEKRRYVLTAWKDKWILLWKYTPAELVWRPLWLLKNRICKG